MLFDTYGSYVSLRVWVVPGFRGSSVLWVFFVFISHVGVLGWASFFVGFVCDRGSFWVLGLFSDSFCV